MTETVEIPFSWLDELPHELVKCDAIPQFGNTPDFQWEKLSAELAQAFQVDIFSITPGQGEWKISRRKLPAINFSIANMDGEISWIFPEQNLNKMLTMLIAHDDIKTLKQIDKELTKGFYDVLIMETIHAIGNTGSNLAISLEYKGQDSPVQGSVFSLPINIDLKSQKFVGYLLFSQAFMESWRKNHAQEKTRATISYESAEKLLIDVGLEIGQTLLKTSEFKSLSTGDFVLLDQCGFDEDLARGKVYLKYGHLAAARGVLNRGNLKILEPLPYQEVTRMHPPEDIEETSFDEISEDESLQETSDFDDQDDLTEESVVENEEDSGLDEEVTEEEISDAIAREPACMISAKEMDVLVSVELGKIKLSVNQLLNMKQGNLLELNIKPTDTVDLIVGGQCVGKGEMLKMEKTSVSAF